MRFYAENDNQIACNTAVWRGLPVALFLHITARIHACGDFHGNARFLTQNASAFANAAFFLDKSTRTVTIGANALAYGTPEHGVLYLLNNTPALTFTASAVRRTVLCARTSTIATTFVAGIRNGLFTALCRVHKRERHFALNILANLAPRRSCAAAKATAKTAAEDVGENILKPTEAALKAACTAKATHAGVFQLVIVRRPFLRVGERFVRLVDFLELLCRRLVALVSIGVVFHSELSIRRLNLVRARLFIYA